MQKTFENQANNQSNNKLPLAVVSVIFFMWGFLTCLNDILIPHLKAVFSLSYTQSALIQFTFFGAYFIMSIPAGKIVGKIGYKNSIALGLLVAAIGTVMFYPAASVQNYNFFLAALFILASGITILQVAANPYVSLLGSADTASSRLNLAQALNSLGTTVAPYFGSLLILSTAMLGVQELGLLPEAEQLAYKVQQAQAVQTPYLILTGVLVALGVFIFLFKLPNFPGESGSSVGDSATNTQNSTSKKGGFAEVLKKPHVLFGVISIFLYVGAEVSVGSFLISFISLPEIGNMTEKNAAYFVPYFWGGAMVGRFIGSALMRKIDAGKLLGIAAIVSAGLLALTLTLDGKAAMWSVILVGLFNSIMFPTIFSLGIKGLGSLTEEASSLLIMAIVGGAVIPLIHGFSIDTVGLHKAYIVPLLCYVFIAFYGFKGSKIRS